MPALETVAGVAVLRWLISNTSLMVRFRGIRSLLASVRTWEGRQPVGSQGRTCVVRMGRHMDISER